MKRSLFHSTGLWKIRSIPPCIQVVGIGGLGWGALAGPPHSQVPGCSFDLSSFFFKRERIGQTHNDNETHTHNRVDELFIHHLRIEKERENPPPSQLLLLMEGPPWNKHRCRVISKPAFFPSFLPSHNTPQQCALCLTACTTRADRL